MQHPLVNPSLAPFGFVFPRRKKRIEYQPDEEFFNRERLLMRLWDKRNRRNAERPLPIEMIIHSILPARAQANRIFGGDFEFEEKMYFSRDIAVLSSALQWLGSNVGYCFLTENISMRSGFNAQREFILKLAKLDFDLVSMIVHICTQSCVGNGHNCHLSTKTATPRDRALVDGLMFWFGMRQGRTFIATFQHTASKLFARLKCKQMKRIASG